MNEDGYAGEYESMDEREDGCEDQGAGESEPNEDSSNETVHGGSIQARRQHKGLPRGLRTDDKVGIRRKHTC